MREIVLEAHEEGLITLPARLAKQVSTKQRKHRQEDLDRLEKTFVAAKDAVRLDKVWKATTDAPLKPQ